MHTRACRFRSQPLHVGDLAVASIAPVPSPPPAGVPVQCGYAAEQAPLLLGCAGSAPIAAVAFASYGTPSGEASG